MPKAAPEPQGPRVAWCRHCEEQIKKEGPGMPWYHVENDSEKC